MFHGYMSKSNGFLHFAETLCFDVMWPRGSSADMENIDFTATFNFLPEYVIHLHYDEVACAASP